MDSMHSLPQHDRGKLTGEVLRQSTWSFLKPSFLRRTRSPGQLRSTAYLDGLRGLAAFLVYVKHHIGIAHIDGTPLPSAFGLDGDYSLLTLPFLRVFFSGSHFAVPVFFVISGYVLSRRPIQLIHSKGDNVGAALSSAAFRRGIRLWLPVVWTTFTYMIIRHLGVWADYPSLQSSLLLEVKAYFKELLRFTYVLRIEEDPYVNLAVTTFSWNPHTWTIALEYQGSMLLFMVLLAFSTLTVTARLVLTSLLAIYFSLQGSWVSFCFLSGALLAEVELLKLNFMTRESRARTIFFSTCFVSGLWLASMPTVELRAQSMDDLAQNPGWASFAILVPSTYSDIKPFWLSIGAVLLIMSIPHLVFVKRLLETSPMQYLGKISFAFYLVHGPILQVVAVRMYHITGQTQEALGGWLGRYDNWLPVPRLGPTGLELSFLAAHLIILPITFYCAEIVEHIFDAPSVRLARWSHEKLLT